MIHTRLITGTLVDAATLTASSETAELPVANLQDDRRTKVWRAQTTEAYVDIDLGVSRPVGAVAVVNHNLSQAGRFIVQAGTSQGDASLLDITEDAWEPLYGFGEGGFGEHSFGGYLSDEEIAIYYPAGSLRLIYFDQVDARHWRITLSEPDHPDGYVEAGRIMLDAYRSSQRGVSLGLEMLPVDPSPVSYSLGGQAWVDQRPAYRQMTVTYRGAPDALDLWYAVLQEVGRAPFVGDFLHDHPAVSARLRAQLYCHLPQDGGQSIRLGYGNRGEVQLTVRESL